MKKEIIIKYKRLDYFLYFLLLIFFAAMFFLIIYNLNFFRLISMLQPFMWLLTFYCSMVFYFYWYLIDVKEKERGDADFLNFLLKNKKKYSFLGMFFGFLLFFSIMFS